MAKLSADSNTKPQRTYKLQVIIPHINSVSQKNEDTTVFSFDNSCPATVVKD